MYEFKYIGYEPPSVGLCAVAKMHG
jgi:hypothetical protein